MNAILKFKPDRPPTPEEIKRARLAVGDTMVEAGARIYRTEGAWSRYEGGERALDLAGWELYLIKAREVMRERGKRRAG